MLKLSKIQEKHRKNFYQKETYTLMIKTIRPILLKIHSIKTRQYLQNLTNQQNKKNSYTRTRSICLLTGRSRSVYRFFRLSRIKIREYAKGGYFLGVKKAQW